MRLYIFNPEHDLALASNLTNFTAPHAGRKLRADLGCLAALCADAEGCVLVDHVDLARTTYSRLKARVGGPECRFVDKSQLSGLNITQVVPWGWDLALRSFLLRHGVTAVPSVETVGTVREYSHRRHALWLLEQFSQTDHRIVTNVDSRRPMECQSLEAVEQLLHVYHEVVVKAPWSSSGRGVRFVSDSLNAYHIGWIRNVIHSQGSVIVEPYYQKVKDFGMEFESDGKGTVRYLGLSLFQTRNGAYTGNIIASEEEKNEMISCYVPVDLINKVQHAICAALSTLVGGIYEGPLGVDMMVVGTERKDGFLLHPCVEINLRRTMGHVALSIPPFADGFPRVMHISLADRYKLRITKQ